MMNLPMLKSTEPAVEHLRVLRKYFGHSNFRPVQWTIIRSLIEEKHDHCVIMATGYGKSLCYQYPAVFCQGLSIVVSPLISLMQDQVLSLQMSNICACFLGSAQTQTAKSLDEVFSGACRVLYASPEWCTSEYGLNTLKRIHDSRSVTLLAIDEAHCVSQWGHDFRSAFRKLEQVRKVLTCVPVLALTATATPQVRLDICKSLQLRRPKVVITSFDRPNLYLSVSLKSSGKTDQIYRNFTTVMERNGLSHRFSGPTIIYCPTKNKTDEIAEILRDHGIECGVYHAGLSMSRRKQVHEEFLRDKLTVVVATVAFGMGIDKPNVRCLIHYGAPRDIESYYQEVGRAGRDGLPSSCHVFYSSGDFALNSFISSVNGVKSEKFTEHKQLMSKRMQKFLETSQCRRRLLLSYFEDHSDAGEKTSKSDCCDNCDRLLKRGISVQPQSTVNITEEVQLLLQVFRLFDGRFGMTIPIKFLRGLRDPKISVDKMAHQLFGAGKETSDAAWKALGRLCLRESLLKEKAVGSSFRGYKTANRFLASTIEITPAGIDFIHCGDRSGVPFELTQEVEMLFRKKTLPVVVSSKNENRANSWRDNLQQYRNDKSLKKEEEQQALLYRRLKNLRDDLAFSHNCPPHMIIEDNSLFLVARNPPSNKAELADVKGFTEAKLEKFGDAFISQVLEFFGKKDNTSGAPTDAGVLDESDDFLSMMNAEYLNKNAVDYTKLDSTSKEYVLTEAEIAAFDGDNVDYLMLDNTANIENGTSQPVAESDDMWGDEPDDMFGDLPLEQLEVLASPNTNCQPDVNSRNSSVPMSVNTAQSECGQRDVKTEFEIPRVRSVSADGGWKDTKADYRVPGALSPLVDERKAAKPESSRVSNTTVGAVRRELDVINPVSSLTRGPVRASMILKSNIVYEDDSEPEEPEPEPEPSKPKKRTLPTWLTQADAKEKIQKKVKSNSLFKI